METEIKRGGFNLDWKTLKRLGAMKNIKHNDFRNCNWDPNPIKYFLVNAIQKIWIDQNTMKFSKRVIQ